ncbi:hypothetical protein CapIbe_001978 [Capra ibex]
MEGCGGPCVPPAPQDLGAQVLSPRCRHGGLRVCRHGGLRGALHASCSPGPGCSSTVPQVPAWRAVGGPACLLLPRTWVLKYCPPGAGMEGCGRPCLPPAPRGPLGLVHPPSAPALPPAPCSLAGPPFLLLMAMLCRFLQVENCL